MVKIDHSYTDIYHNITYMAQDNGFVKARHTILTNVEHTVVSDMIPKLNEMIYLR